MLRTLVAELADQLAKEMYFQILPGGEAKLYEVRIPETTASIDGHGEIARTRQLYWAATTLLEKKHYLKTLAELTGAWPTGVSDRQPHCESGFATRATGDG